MLKNVAIPLMLAASEAEAATEAQLKAALMAMKMDKDADIPELIAGSTELGECQEGSSTAIADAIRVVGEKETALTNAKNAYDAEVATGDATATPPVAAGPWSAADVARKAAVEAAEAAEAPTTTLGGLLDELRDLHEVERAKAKLYYDAVVAYSNGELDRDAKTQTHSDLDGAFQTATSLKSAADAAVSAATAAWTDETQSRNWLYCELGAVPTWDTAVSGHDTNGNGTGTFTTPSSWWAATFNAGTTTRTYPTTRPDTCDVPQVLDAGVATPGSANANEAGATECTAACSAESTCDTSVYDGTAAAGSQCMFHTIVRPAITYYNLAADTSPSTLTDGAGYLSAETNTSPFRKWNATLALAQSTATLEADTGTSLGSTTRSTAGKIAYYEGLQSKYKWLKEQRNREKSFFMSVKDAANLAKRIALDQAYGVGGSSGSAGTVLTMPATASQDNIYKWPSTWQSFTDVTTDANVTALGTTPVTVNRFAENQNGAAKILTDATTARDGTADGTTQGSTWRMHSTRAQQANGWAITVATQPGSGTDYLKREYVTDFTAAATVTNMNTWTTAQNGATTKSDLYLWWQAAFGASKIADDWAKLFRDTTSATGATGGAKGQWTAATPTSMSNMGTASKACLETSGTWVAGSATPTSSDDCRDQCVAYTASYSTGIVMQTPGASTALAWGTETYLPRQTAGGKWCSSFSYDSAASTQTCKLNTSAVSAIVDGNVPNAQASGTWVDGNGSGAAGDCKNMTVNHADTNPVTNEFLNFATLAKAFPAAYDAGKQDDSAGLYAAMVTDVATQAGLETAWLQAYYYKQYWLAIDYKLDPTTAGTKAKSYLDYYNVVAGSGANEYEYTGVVGLNTANENNLTAARNELAYKQVDVALKQAHVTLLGRQLNRVQQQIHDLEDLTRAADSTTTPATEAGELIAAQTKRQAVYDEYNASVGAMSVSAALTAKNDALATLVDRNTTTYPDTDTTTDQATTGEGTLAMNRRLARIAWEAAQTDVTNKGIAITSAENSVTLASLRTAVETTGTDWTNANEDLIGLINTWNGAKDELKQANDALTDATLACQVAAYDKYRQVLDEALGTREANLATIKTMLEAQAEEPAPGAAGSRCEKALSNGTYRPKRGVEAGTCGGKDSGLCCGAARVWMKTGTTADSGWRTIETCQSEDAENYSYQPPRKPMELTMPTPVSVPFACIEGAKALAAAASAAAAAVYMLA